MACQGCRCRQIDLWHVAPPAVCRRQSQLTVGWLGSRCLHASLQSQTVLAGVLPATMLTSGILPQRNYLRCALAGNGPVANSVLHAAATNPLCGVTPHGAGRHPAARM
jgi:hypothetical protein